MLQRSNILVLALSSFSRIWGSWVSSSHDGPQPSTRARSLPVPKGNTPSWHWKAGTGFIWHQCLLYSKWAVCLYVPVRVEWLCIFMWACSEQRQKAQLEHWPKTNYRLCTCSGKLYKSCLKRLSIQYVYDSLWLSFIFSRRETNPNSVFIVIVKITLMLLCTTCLCRLSLSISERTHPTLPSPPHTKIRKLSNFWNRRKLEKTQQRHSYLFCRISFQLKPNNKAGALWYLWIFTADLFASVFLTRGVAHRWPGQRLELGSEAAWSAVGTSLPGCRHFWSWQRPGGDWHMTGDRWPSRSLRSHGSSKNNKSQHGSVSLDWKQWNLHGKIT